MSTPAQITIAGVLSREHIAALIDVAIEAGAALMVQPRALPAAELEVVDAAPRRPKALPPARRAKTRQVEPTDAALPLLPDRVLRALRAGPILAAEFRRVTGLSVYEAKRLVASGLIVATGVTNGRRYALPGHSAKEAP